MPTRLWRVARNEESVRSSRRTAGQDQPRQPQMAGSPGNLDPEIGGGKGEDWRCRAGERQGEVGGCDRRRRIRLAVVARKIAPAGMIAISNRFRAIRHQEGYEQMAGNDLHRFGGQLAGDRTDQQAGEHRQACNDSGRRQRIKPECTGKRDCGHDQQGCERGVREPIRIGKIDRQNSKSGEARPVQPDRSADRLCPDEPRRSAPCR